MSQWSFVNSCEAPLKKKTKPKAGGVQLQKVQNNTKHVSFRLYAFVRRKNKNIKPHKDIHV